MAAVRAIDGAERRRRLAERHLLRPDTRVRTAEEVADALVALHATTPSTVVLAAAARLAPGAEPVAELERALYADATLVRMHGMRQTVFVFPRALVPAVADSTARPLAERERPRLVKFLADGLGHDERWLREVEESVLAVLRERGETSGAELGEALPRLREQVVVAAGKPYEARQAVGSRILRNLGFQGRVVRGRPAGGGGWTSGSFRWAAAEPPEPGDPGEARAALVRAWLARFGPGTEADVKWWTGWTLTQARKALAAVGAERVALDGGGAGFVLPGDAAVGASASAGEPWAALLPALDSTPMGWQDRSFFLPEEQRAAHFDRSGNIGPTVWWNGRVIGGWSQRKDGSVVFRLLEDHGKAAEAAVAARAAVLEQTLGPTRVVPAFRTPLERELSA